MGESYGKYHRITPLSEHESESQSYPNSIISNQGVKTSYSIHQVNYTEESVISVISSPQIDHIKVAIKHNAYLNIGKYWFQEEGF
jgi:hypothetical protein